MSNLWLTVEVAPGAGIGRTCDEAIALSAKTWLTIWFSFNGVKCLARAGDDPRRLEADWNKQMGSNSQHKIASDKGETAN